MDIIWPWLCIHIYPGWWLDSRQNTSSATLQMKIFCEILIQYHNTPITPQQTLHNTMKECSIAQWWNLYGQFIFEQNAKLHLNNTEVKKRNEVIRTLFNTDSLTHAPQCRTLADVVHYHYVNNRQKIREWSGGLEPQHSPSIQSKHMLLLFINTILLHHVPISWVQSGINLSPDPEANELHMMINLIRRAIQGLLIHYYHCVSVAYTALPLYRGAYTVSQKSEYTFL